MNNVLIFSQMRHRRPEDFKMWLLWYSIYIKADKILILDDESEFDILQYKDEIVKQYNIKTEIIILKQQLFDKFKSKFSRQIRNQNLGFRYLNAQDNDICLAPDDDEFWWYDISKYQSFKECLLTKFKENNATCLNMPWIMMSSHTPLKNRKNNENFSDVFNYYTKLSENEVKYFLLWKHNQEIDCQHKGIKNISKNIFTKKNNNEQYVRAVCTDEMYFYDLKLYHFNITTEEEFNLKMNSDTSTHKKRWWMSDDMNFLNYNKKTHPDFTGYDFKDDSVKYITDDITNKIE